MTNKDLRQLAKMKKLIKQGYRRFESRPDRDYLIDLLNIGISVDEAWNNILLLSAYDNITDYRPTYYKNDDALIFKKEINGIKVYIKLKIENKNKEETVCLSFHEDYK